MLGTNQTAWDKPTEDLLNLTRLALGQVPPALVLTKLAQLKDWLIAQANAPLAAHESYGRRILHANPELEIMLAHWRPGHECLPHDHGSANGRVIAVEGLFTESDYDWQGGHLVETGSRAIQSPAILEIDSAQIHSMRCDSAIGLTLHMYAPAIRDMKVFDIGRRRTFVVTEDCGAWAPRSHQIVSQELWAGGSV